MTQTINAVLLAAGYGSRLRPLTLTTPKCLVEVGGLPLLERWLRCLEKCGCENVLINTHYLADKVVSFLEGRKSNTMKIRATYEPTLLGTAGTIIANEDFFSGGVNLVIHADNATDINLNDLIQAHYARPKGCCLTMLTFSTENPYECGIVQIDKHGVVRNFYEKVREPHGNRANGAVYVFNSDFIDVLKAMRKPLTDFSTHVLPKLIGRIATYHTEENFLDIGTPENLEKSKKLWSSNS